MTAPAIEVDRLSKIFGSGADAVVAVDELSFRVEPGRVTGFLGPNGAGKTTTMRIALGLVQPSAGQVTIGGRLYRDLDAPLREVGASLEATSFHPARTAEAHLGIQARAAGIPLHRVAEVLEQVGLTAAARRKVGGFSLGMRQRLGLAGALLGDPGVLVLDEPINGLDPEGIRWVRGLLTRLAAEGRTVLVSSHVLSEVEQAVDELVVIVRGRSVYQGPLSGLTGGGDAVIVAGDDRAALMLSVAPHIVGMAPDGSFRLTGIEADEVGRLARTAGVALRHLSTESRNLEQVFLDLVAGDEPAPLAPLAALTALAPPDPATALPAPSVIADAPETAGEAR